MSLRLRLRIWWRRYALTEALADGADPDASDAPTLVARELIGMRTRQRLATALDRLLSAAYEPTVPWSPGLPLNKREIAHACDELAELAERLREARPVPVHAAAGIVMLRSDSTSPLYGRVLNRAAWDLVRTARLALDDPIA
jgi:hypothetical protein